MGLESSKAVHHIRVLEGDDGGGGSDRGGKIEFIVWERNVTGEGRSRRERMKKKEKLGSERRILLDGERTGDVAVDLPHELMFLEVETALPKLSPLPVSGGSG
jgi:anaphase-promoting complex subunit 4